MTPIPVIQGRNLYLQSIDGFGTAEFDVERYKDTLIKNAEIPLYHVHLVDL